MQRTDYPVNLLDVIDYNLVVNDKSNLITTLEVILGTASEQDYNSYASHSLKDASLMPGWSQGLESGYWSNIVTNRNIMAGGAYFGSMGTVDVKYSNIFRKFYIPDWTEGSEIDTSVPIIITLPSFGSMTEQWIGNTKVYKIDVDEGYPAIIGRYSFNSSNGSIIFNSACVDILKERWSDNHFTLEEILSWRVSKPKITCRFFKKESKSIALTPTIFDTTWVGNGGVGKRRRAVFSSLGITEDLTWYNYEDGNLIVQEQKGYNDTSYATDRAMLMLSRVNDLVTSGSILLTMDAFRYYKLSVDNRVNITQTKYTNIYNDSNGFPLDMVGYSFDGSSYQVTLQVEHIRNYITTKNFR